jgi:hypothetical protein
VAGDALVGKGAGRGACEAVGWWLSPSPHVPHPANWPARLMSPKARRRRRVSGEYDTLAPCIGCQAAGRLGAQVPRAQTLGEHHAKQAWRHARWGAAPHFGRHKGRLGIGLP